jgi:hypothetical protein
MIVFGRKYWCARTLPYLAMAISVRSAVTATAPTAIMPGTSFWASVLRVRWLEIRLSPTNLPVSIVLTPTYWVVSTVFCSPKIAAFLAISHLAMPQYQSTLHFYADIAFADVELVNEEPYPLTRRVIRMQAFCMSMCVPLCIDAFTLLTLTCLLLKHCAPCFLSLQLRTVLAVNHDPQIPDRSRRGRKKHSTHTH